MQRNVSIAVCEPQAAGQIQRLKELNSVEVFDFTVGSYTADDVGMCDIVIGWNDTVREAILNVNSRIMWLQVWSAVVDYLPLGELEKRGVTVTTASGANAKNIAQQVIGYMIAFVRNLHRSALSQIKHEWSEFSNFTELTGKTVAVLGTGQIGSQIARYAHVFEMKTIGVNRTGHMVGDFDEVVPIERMHDVIPTADFVVNAMPLTGSTRGIVGKEFFASMNRRAYYINVGRGATTDSDALKASLKAGTIAGAALDVTNPEPLDPSDELWSTENVIITAHTAGYSDMYAGRIIDSFIENYQHFVYDKPLELHVVDYARGY